MEEDTKALKASLRRESWCGAGQPQGFDDEVLGEEVGWLVDRGSFFGEGFSVDDLLDLGEDEMEPEEDEVGEEFEAEDEARQKGEERSNSNSSSSSSSSSSMTFELPPPPLSDICLPAHDVEQLEWVSYIIDDSISEFPPPSAGAALPPEDAQREDRHASDAAAQGHRMAPSVCAISTEAMALVKAKRSKRPRSAAATAAWSMSGGPLSLADSSCSSTDTGTTTSASSCSSNTYSPLLIHHAAAGAAFDQSFLLCSPPLPPKNHKPKKKRGRKPKPQPPSSAAAPASFGERRCSHCGVQKTPQWRAGPLGAKTLCNACGVRFKSGRLLPEYRPACSPTFVSQLHSNSHRKVLEMRRKKESEFIAAAAPPVASF